MRGRAARVVGPDEVVVVEPLRWAAGSRSSPAARPGIGFDICRRLLADGARLLLGGLTDADVSAALARLGEDAGRVTGFAGDLSVPGVADDLLGHALGTFGKSTSSSITPAVA